MLVCLIIETLGSAANIRLAALDLHIQFSSLFRNHDSVSRTRISGDDCTSDTALQSVLDVSLQGSRTKHRIESILPNMFQGAFTYDEVQLLVGKPLSKLIHNQADNLLNLRQRERLEHHDVVNTIQEFRSEMVSHFRHNIIVRRLCHSSIVRDTIEQMLRTDIRRHDHDRVLEIDGAS